MRTLFALLVALSSLAASGVSVRQEAGIWQGTLPATPEGARMVVHITPAKAGGRHATMYIQNGVPGWKQSDVFERGVPSARVVRLAHASHHILLSNGADVLREMNAFISGLPQ